MFASTLGRARLFTPMNSSCAKIHESVARRLRQPMKRLDLCGTQTHLFSVATKVYLEIPNASKFSCHSGKTRFFQMAPNIFGLRRALRMDTFSSFGSFRDVKASLVCFLKLCSCAMFACGCAMFACGYAVLARDQTHFLHSTSCCLFVE